jgi:hypothetical protein
MLQELIQKLQADHGLSAEQSTGILNTVSSFIKQKFPMMEGAVDGIFSDKPAAAAATATADQAQTEEKKEEGGIMDKISDVIPGQAGEKIEEFTKNAAHKAEEVFDNVKEKLGNLFGGDKN